MKNRIFIIIGICLVLLGSSAPTIFAESSAGDTTQAQTQRLFIGY